MILAADPWADFAPSLLAGVISGFVTGIVVGLVLFWIQGNAARRAQKVAYELEWETIRPDIVMSLSEDDWPRFHAAETQHMIAVDNAIGTRPIRLWQRTLNNPEVDALVDLQNAWDRRSLSYPGVENAIWVQLVASRNTALNPNSLIGRASNGWNDGNPQIDELWTRFMKKPEFAEIMTAYGADLQAVHDARGKLQRILTTRAP